MLMIVLAHILTKKQVNKLVRKKPSNKLSPIRMSDIEIIISKYSIIDLKHKLKSIYIPLYY